VKRVAFVVHWGRPEAVAVASQLSHGLEEAEVLTLRLPSEPIEATEAVGTESLAAGVDLVVSVGGDGTFLRAAQIAYGYGSPVVGVKVGRLGFLTETEPQDAQVVIEDALAGRAQIEERMPLIASSGAWEEPQWALNEVIVEKQTRHRLVTLAVKVDGAEFTTFSADGVIVATSTGSTAYSFSARGPIVLPTLPCIVVTPVAAHMVFDRSLVLSSSETVTLEVVGDEPGELSADGREGVTVPVGTSVEIASAPTPTLMVRPSNGKSFLSTVHDKFGLPGGRTT